MVFDEAYWGKRIKNPDWYLEFDSFTAKLKGNSRNNKELSRQIRQFFEKALQNSQVSLGSSGYDFDSERQSVDTVVIHHTSAQPGYKLSYLNATHLLNVYVPAYASALNKSQPIWSGHFRNSQQVFWAYHWLMRMDGTFEQLLDDDQIGWHAGNWEVNKYSVAICLDNDYENKDPTDEILQKLAKFIGQKYPGKKIVGHHEAQPDTICPGTNFLDDWKQRLLNYLA